MYAQVFYSAGAESKAMKWTRPLRKYSYKKGNRTNLAIFEYKETRANARSERAKECARAQHLGSGAEKGFGGGRMCWHGMLQVGQVRGTRRLLAALKRFYSKREAQV